MFIQMFKDEFLEVCFYIIFKFELVNKVIGIDWFFEFFFLVIVYFVEDKQWCVCLVIIGYMFLFVGQLGVGFFNEKFSSFCMGWFGDIVFFICEVVIYNFKRLIEVFGVEWVS